MLKSSKYLADFHFGKLEYYSFKEDRVTNLMLSSSFMLPMIYATIVFTCRYFRIEAGCLAYIMTFYYTLLLEMRYSFFVNPFTVGNPLFWENFLLPECLRDSIV